MQYPCRYGIAVNVPEDGEEVAFVLDQDGLVPTLKDMSLPLVLPVEVPGEIAVDPVHNLVQGLAPRLEQKMIVIAYEHVAKESESQAPSASIFKHNLIT